MIQLLMTLFGDNIHKYTHHLQDFLINQYNEYFFFFIIINVLSASFSVLTFVVVVKHVRGVAKINKLYASCRKNGLL